MTNTKEDLKNIAIKKSNAISNLNNLCDTFSMLFFKVYFLKNNKNLDYWIFSLSNILNIVNNTIIKRIKKLNSKEIYKHFFTYSINEEAEVHILINKVELSGIKLPIITSAEQILFLNSYKRFALFYCDVLSTINDLKRNDWEYLIREHFSLI